MIYRQEIDVTGDNIVHAKEIFSVEKSRRNTSAFYDLWFSPGGRTYKIHTFGTGHPTPWGDLPPARDEYDFIGTVVTDSGLVWHSFAQQVWL